jgi:hypothetical protein
MTLCTQKVKRQWIWIGLPSPFENLNLTNELLSHSISSQWDDLVHTSKIGQFLACETNQMIVTYRLIRQLCESDVNEENISCLNTVMLYFMFARCRGELCAVLVRLFEHDEVSYFIIF